MKLDKIAMAAAGIVLLAIIGMLAYWWFSRDPDDIRLALADALGVSEGEQAYFFLNLPPRTGRYPGSIFPGDTALPAFEIVASDDEQLLRSSPLEFSANQRLADDLGGGFSGAGASVLAAQSRAGKVKVEIEGLRIVEMSGDNLKARLLASQAAVAAAARGTEVYAITYAYEGTVRLTLSAEELVETDSELSADALGKLNLELLREGSSDLVFVSTSPIVFAFQAVAADYVVQSLDPLPEDVELTRLKADPD